jgi:DNA-binding transcriptional ArsR family regulator
MVYPSQATETKIAILNALEGHSSAEKGIGYNRLFEIINAKVGGSRRTFHKYLSELVTAGAVRKERDSRHKAGVVIYKTSMATQEEVLIDLAERISKMDTTPPIRTEYGEFFDWKMVQLSNLLGRSLCSLTREVREGKKDEPYTYAFARILSEGKKAEMNLLSENKRRELSYGITMGGVDKSPPMKRITISHGITIPVPNSIDQSVEKEIMDELHELDALAQEWVDKAEPIYEKALSCFPESERHLVEEKLRE